jgi:hypothetical protein
LYGRINPEALAKIIEENFGQFKRGVNKTSLIFPIIPLAAKILNLYFTNRNMRGLGERGNNLFSPEGTPGIHKNRRLDAPRKDRLRKKI